MIFIALLALVSGGYLGIWAESRKQRRHAKENERLREALRERVIHVDPMSWHRELMMCELCEGRWTRAGYKTGVGDQPEQHKPGCIAASEGKTE